MHPPEKLVSNDMCSHSSKLSPESTYLHTLEISSRYDRSVLSKLCLKSTLLPIFDLHHTNLLTSYKLLACMCMYICIFYSSYYVILLSVEKISVLLQRIFSRCRCRMVGPD